MEDAEIVRRVRDLEKELSTDPDVTRAIFTCAKFLIVHCHEVNSTDTNIKFDGMKKGDMPIGDWIVTIRKLEPCPKCGQVNSGQTGEYACSACGLPQLHDG